MWLRGNERYRECKINAHKNISVAEKNLLKKRVDKIALEADNKMCKRLIGVGNMISR